MDIEFLMERLEQYILEESPKFLGSRLVSDEEARSQLIQLREAIPDEIFHARKILQEREMILEQAREEAKRIKADARVEAERAVSEHRIAEEARREAKRILQQAGNEADGLRADADEYVFDMLSQLQGELTRNLHVVENGLQRLEAERETTLRHREELI
ncbi:MAG: hypothetical protein ACLFTI_01210 [Anaerolineales bacterium]